MKNRSIASAAVAALALLLSGCSTSSSGKAESNAGLKGEPVVIGVQSLDTGPVAYPQSTYGAKAGEYYINNTLGGINGHPVKLDICSGDGTPETGVKCANHFVSTNVSVVFDAYDGTSVGAMTPILQSAGIPIVGLLAGQGVAESAPYGTAFYFSGPLETSALGMVTVLSKLKKKKASLAVSDGPSSHHYVDDLVKPMGDKLGVEVTAVYTKNDSINFQVLAATELDSKPDVAGLISLPEDGCTGLISALRQSNYKGTIFAGSCSQFVKALGADAAGAVIQPRLWVPESRAHAPKDVQKELDAFAKAMKAVKYEKEQSARSLYSFAGLIDLSKIMSGISGKITNETVKDAMMKVKDFQTFLGPKVTCDGKQWPKRPGACSHEAIFFEVQKDGTLKPTGGSDAFVNLEPDKVAA